MSPTTTCTRWENDRTFSLDELAVRFGLGYSHAQVFAPEGSDFVAIEPMTAATNALVTGEYPLVRPGERFDADFEITTAEAG